jgi:hypothetical protein
VVGELISIFLTKKEKSSLELLLSFDGTQNAFCGWKSLIEAEGGPWRVIRTAGPAVAQSKKRDKKREQRKL